MRSAFVKELVEIREAVRVHANDGLFQKEPDKKDGIIKTSPENFPADNESPVKTKRKESIIRLLSERSLTSLELSFATGMSRTRCNEYLRELEKDGMAKGAVKNKKKFYRLARWERQ